MIDRFAPLTTDRLTLEPIGDDVARALARGDVSGLRPAEGWPQPGTPHGVAFALERGHPPGWLVVADGLVIGDCGIHAPVDAEGAVEIGYGLAAPFRGRGLGTEVVVAISDWLGAQPGVTTVRARTQPANAASRRVLAKAGFVEVGVDAGEVVYERVRPRDAN